MNCLWSSVTAGREGFLVVDRLVIFIYRYFRQQQVIEEYFSVIMRNAILGFGGNL